MAPRRNTDVVGQTGRLDPTTCGPNRCILGMASSAVLAVVSGLSARRGQGHRASFAYATRLATRKEVEVVAAIAITAPPPLSSVSSGVADTLTAAAVVAAIPQTSLLSASAIGWAVRPVRLAVTLQLKPFAAARVVGRPRR